MPYLFPIFSNAHKNNDISFQPHSIPEQQKYPYKYMERYILKTVIIVLKYLFSLISAETMSSRMVHLSFASHLTFFQTLYWEKLLCLFSFFVTMH